MSKHGTWMAKAEVIVIGAVVALAGLAYVISRLSN
jgi:hypothetical protein